MVGDSLAVPPNLGDWVGIVGVLISIGGFGLTIFNVVRSRRAAERAEKAAASVRSDLKRYDIVTEFSRALAEIGEIKRLQRNGEWENLPDRYALIRQALISVRAVNPHLSDEQQATITGALTHLRESEKTIESHLARTRNPPNVAKTNEVLSRQADQLAEILAVMRVQKGSDTYE